MRGRRDARAGDAADEARLQFVLAVVDHHRRLRERGGVHARRKMPRGKAWRGNRAVAHGAQRMHVAALQRARLGGDGAQHGAVAQQVQGVILVVHAHIEQVTVPLVQAGQCGDEPGFQRVVVHRDGDRARARRDAGLGQEVRQRLGFQRLHRPHAPQQLLAGGRGPAWRLAHDDDLAEAVLQRLDPLRDGRRRDREAACRGFEAAFFQYGGEGGQLGVDEVHGAANHRLDLLT